jgi:hypothetical protein
VTRTSPKTYLQLPIALPSRLDPIQKACPAEVFEANPAACGEGTIHIALTGCVPSVAISKASVTGNTLLVTFKTGATGTVWLSGYGLRTTHKKPDRWHPPAPRCVHEAGRQKAQASQTDERARPICSRAAGCQRR